MIFYRNVLDSFDLTKATILWVAGTSIVVFLASSAARIDWSRRELRAAVGFALTLMVSSLTSIRPWSSVFGQYQRYGGLLTYLSLVGIFLLIAHFFDQKWQERSLLALRLGAVICAAYVVLQSLGLDPWSWSSPGQNKPLFGTMGNINTSSGLLGTIAPLFLVGLLGSASRGVRAMSTVAFVLVGGAIGLNESFQGNVAGLVSVLILLAVSLRTSHLSQAIFAIALAGTFLVSGIFVNSNGEFAILAIAAAALGLAGAAISTVVNQQSSLLLGSRRRILLTAIGIGLSLALGALTIGDRIISEVRGGMVERAAFYRSAIGLWRDRPFLGFGPETFGYLYSIHRPAWHAIDYEGNRPSSAHSVPLGLLASGGLVVFVAYLVFVGFVLRRGMAGIREADASTRWIRICVSGAFLAALVQSLVSVEHVALLMVFFTLAGLTVASSRSSRSVVADPRRIRGRSRATSFTAALMVLVPVALAPQLTRPFRADWSARKGLELAYQRGDLSGALDSMKSAVSIAPWDPQQLLREVSILQQIGDATALAPEAIKLSTKFNCLPSVSIGAAYAAAAIGDFSKASEIGECAMNHDPNSVLVRESVAELYAQMAEALLRVSKVDVAAEFLRDSLELDPENARASQLRISLSSTAG